MNKMMLAVSLGLLAGCSTPNKSTEMNSIVKTDKIIFKDRQPATHAYRTSKCSNEKYELNYDGPGSNYLVGGLSNLYLKRIKDAQGKMIKLLSYEDTVDTPIKVGHSFDEAGILHVNFSTIEYKTVGETDVTPKVGSSCTPGETDFLHTAWQEDQLVEINGITKEASNLSGLKVGSQMKFSKCERTTDHPIKCPRSGKYTADDLK
jgi:hypothetical protein